MTKVSIEEYRKLIKKKPKYGSERIEYNGRMYDSKKEAAYAKRLEYLKHAHKIEERVVRIEYQVPYSITAKNKVVATYFADFRVTYGDLHQEVVDVKGFRTEVYKLKKKLVEALHEIKIIEVQEKER